MLQARRPNATPVLASPPPPLCGAPLFAGCCVCVLPIGCGAARCEGIVNVVARNGGRAYVLSPRAPLQAWTHVLADVGATLDGALAALTWPAPPAGVAVCTTAWVSDCVKQRTLLPWTVRP
jgi:hypothetical protein